MCRRNHRHFARIGWGVIALELQYVKKVCHSNIRNLSRQVDAEKGEPCKNCVATGIYVASCVGQLRLQLLASTR